MYRRTMDNWHKRRHRLKGIALWSISITLIVYSIIEWFIIQSDFWLLEISAVLAMIIGIGLILMRIIR